MVNKGQGKQITSKLKDELNKGQIIDKVNEGQDRYNTG